MPSRADLDAAAARLDELGVAHDGVKDIGIGCLLEFRDPAGIALELWADAEWAHSPYRARADSDILG